jgi:hypothetical protein
MTNQTIIPFDNKKRLKTLFWGIALAVAIILSLVYMLFMSKTIFLYYVVMFTVFFVLSIYFIISGIKALTDKNEAGLILDANGIHSRTTPIGKKLGVISWTDIDRLTPISVYGSKFVAVSVKDKAKFLPLLTSLEQKQLDKTGAAINISDNELTIGFDELYKLLDNYYSTYKKA